MSNLIYVVEDDENIRELISTTLNAGGFETITFSTSKSFKDKLNELTSPKQNGNSLLPATEPMGNKHVHSQTIAKCENKKLPALILLDIMLPDESGIDIIKYLKKIDEYKDIPVIFLTAKSSEIDKVNGLNMGADDYIVKPFGVLELIARVNTVIRRCCKPKENNQDIYYKDLIINTDEKAIYKGENKINLTFKEYELFLFLHKNRGMVLKRETLLEQVWGFNFEVETRTVDAHIKSLRNKLSDDLDKPIYISTLRGHGYMLLK